MFDKKTLVMAVALLAAGAAQAHVGLQPASATAGGYQVLRFSVGHGCNGKATTALRLEIPAGVTVARPQPKPGWTLEIQHPPGQAEAVSAVVWRGVLPPDQFDEFLVMTKLPASQGPLSIPAVQTCGADEVRWVDPPGGRNAAPTLDLTPAPSGQDHRH